MKKQYAIYCIFNFHRIILTVHILDFLLYINYIFAYIISSHCKMEWQVAMQMWLFEVQSAMRTTNMQKV